MYSVHTVVHAADMYYGAIWNDKNGHVERLCFVKEDANGLRWMEKTCDEESWQKSNENMLDLFRVWVRLHQLFFNQKIIMYCVLRCASIPRVMATENYTQWRRSLLHDDERNGARSIMQPESTADEGRTSSHPPTFRPRFVHDRWISSPIYTDWSSSSSSSSSFDLFTLICPLFSFFFFLPFCALLCIWAGHYCKGGGVGRLERISCVCGCTAIRGEDSWLRNSIPINETGKFASYYITSSSSSSSISYDTRQGPEMDDVP